MYLACKTRPDITFVMGQLSKQNADPGKGHLQAAKKLIRYLQGTMQIGLIFGKTNNICQLSQNFSPFRPKGYANRNFTRDSKD